MATKELTKLNGREIVERREEIKIQPPKFETIAVVIKGIAPYMQAKFSAKAKLAMMAKMAAGPTAKSKKVREARDFDDDFKQSIHFATEGWIGIPAPAFRNACIDVCRMTQTKMTHAKMSIFILSDGLDATDGTPLVRLIAPQPERVEMAVRNDSGVADIRVRPLWREWGATVRIRFDADQFTTSDVVNLLSRAGQQVGIGEGRPFARESNGLGYGMFEVKQVENA